jgi:hypothetical protein
LVIATEFAEKFANRSQSTFPPAQILFPSTNQIADFLFLVSAKSAFKVTPYENIDFVLFYIFIDLYRGARDHFRKYFLKILKCNRDITENVIV